MLTEKSVDCLVVSYAYAAGSAVTLPRSFPAGSHKPSD
jgi:hypothetical protein